MLKYKKYLKEKCNIPKRTERRWKRAKLAETCPHVLEETASDRKKGEETSLQSRLVLAEANDYSINAGSLTKHSKGDNGDWLTKHTEQSRWPTTNVEHFFGAEKELAHEETEETSMHSSVNPTEAKDQPQCAGPYKNLLGDTDEPTENRCGWLSTNTEMTSSILQEASSSEASQHFGVKVSALKQLEETNMEGKMNPAEVTDKIWQQQVCPNDADKKRKQHELLMLALKLKHNLTDKAVEDILKVINAVSQKHVVSTSKHCFYKTFTKVENLFELHPVCKQCSAIMQSGDGLAKCGACEKTEDMNKCMKEGNFFIELPLEPQLRNLLENEEINAHILPPSTLKSSVSDIFDGELYKKALKHIKSFGGVSHLSLTFSCDGIPLYNSSNCNVWPLLYTINELDPAVRSKHVMIAALWVGRAKPDMNTFLEPFVKECAHLQQVGFKWSSGNATYTTKVLPLILVSDSVARPLLQNFKQFNGEFGCSFCLQKGFMVEKGQGQTRVYPFETECELRNHNQTIHFAERALEKGTPVNGVKGPSVLSLLPGFDIIHGCVPDYMHCVLLGVARAYTNLWFCSENHGKPWYIGRSVTEVDDRLYSIQPPRGVSRIPRSVTERHFWKAHEWYMWLFFYSVPVLKGILPERFLVHWAKLIKGVGYLLSEQVTSEDITTAEKLISTFVQEAEALYGVCNMTFNIHLCLHLSQSVKDWGPLWTHSAFVFENYNRELLEMVKSTQSVALQICKTFLLQKVLPVFGKSLMNDASFEVQDSFKLLTTSKKEVQMVEQFEGVTALGRPQRKLIEDDDYLALHSLVHTFKKDIVHYYDRIVVNGEIIHAVSYIRETKRNSHVVFLKDDDDNAFLVRRFVFADLGTGGMCYAIGNYFQKQKHSFFSALSNPCHFVAVSKTVGHLTAISASKIKQKGLFVCLPGLKVDYILKFLNRFEMTT